MKLEINCIYPIFFLVCTGWGKITVMISHDIKNKQINLNLNKENVVFYKNVGRKLRRSVMVSKFVSLEINYD